MQQHSDTEKESVPEQGCGCQPPPTLEFNSILKGKTSTAQI